MKISETDEFKKDFKKLSKVYRTLPQDFEIAKKAILANPKGNGSKHWNLLKSQEEVYILKMRMMCRAVKGASFRLIYLYNQAKIELLFIEIYFKGIKQNEDTERIKSIAW